MKTTVFRLCAALAAITFFAAPAVAHVSLEKGETAVGAGYKAVLKVPHGCKGSSTTKVEVTIPEGYIGVKPMPKPGWQLATSKGPYATAYEFYHGAKLIEGVKTVTWSEGELPDDNYDEFVVSGFIARELKADSTLYFKVVQTCAKGEQKWVEIPGEGVDSHDLEAPAAALKLVAGDAGVASARPPVIKFGTLVIEAPFARATPPGANVGAAYLKIRNTSLAPEKLLSATISVADRIEIHDMSEKDGVWTMRELSGGLDIPASAVVELKPGGMHMMLMGLKGALTAGDTISAKLKFQNAGEVEVKFDVLPIGAEKPKHSHH